MQFQLLFFYALCHHLLCTGTYLYDSAVPGVAVSFGRCGIHGTIVVAVFHGLIFVTATNGVSMCAPRYVGVPPQTQTERFQPTRPLNFKSARAVHSGIAVAAAAVH